MVKFNIIFAFVASTIFSLSVTGHGTNTKNNIPIRFSLYQHEIQSGPNVTVFQVARANITPTSPTSFGSLVVGSMITTTGPEMNTGRVGRFDGLATFTSLTELAAIMQSVFVFTDGEYNGSKINILGRRTARATGDEVPIVGGTGVFRMARGYIHSSTYSYDPSLFYAVYVHEFYVYVNDFYVSSN